MITVLLLAATLAGFRGDRNGFFEGCQNLPTSWSEEKNVVWKTKLPGWCHGELLLVKGKIYLLNEFDPKAVAQIGPSLSCLDAATGKLLWTKPLDHFDIVADSAKVKEQWIAQRQLINDLEAYRDELIKEAGGYSAAKAKDAEICEKQRTKLGAFKPIGGTGPSVKWTGKEPKARDEFLSNLCIPPWEG